MPAGVQHGVVLDGGGNDVVSRAGQPRNGQIVAFGPTAGEHNFRGPATQQQRDGVPRPLDGGTRFLSMMMDRRSAAAVLAKKGAHGFEHFRQNRRGGVIVEVNPEHGSYYSTCFFRRL